MEPMRFRTAIEPYVRAGRLQREIHLAIRLAV